MKTVDFSETIAAFDYLFEMNHFYLKIENGKDDDVLQQLMS